MKLMRNLMLAAVAVSFVTIAGCGGAPKGGSASEDKSAIDQLKGMPAELDAEVSKLMSPIDSVDALIGQVGTLPAKLGISGGDLIGQIKAVMAGSPAPTAAGLKEGAQGELDAFLASVKSFNDGIKNAPDNVAGLTAKCVSLTAKLPALAAQVTTEAGVTTANPFASPEDKAKAAADKDAVAGIQTEVSAKISETQGKITGIPAKAVEAGAKFAAALVGG